MSNRSSSAVQSGFTLLELLVVLAILAAVAGIGAQALRPAQDVAGRQLAEAEMTNLAVAIQRFRADTGYWPKQGVFAADVADSSPDMCPDVAVNPACVAGAVVATAHPASLSQLFNPPVDGGGAPILPFDPASGAGWNGPYIRDLTSEVVAVSTNLQADGTGDPLQDVALVDPLIVDGVGDPWAAESVTSGANLYALWFRYLDTDLDGRFEEISARSLGRPYLYLLDTGDSDGDGLENWEDPDFIPAAIGCQMPCLISLGPDGKYDANDPAGGDDIVVNVAGN